MFPSWSAGWVISEESWFNKEKLGIDFLKIRGSFGILGRDNIQPWLWTQLYSRNADGGPIYLVQPPIPIVVQHSKCRKEGSTQMYIGIKPTRPI